MDVSAKEQCYAKIREAVTKYRDESIRIRRYLHSHPDLSTEEYETADFIASYLTSSGIPFQKGISKTGLVALVQGKNPEKHCIGIRADMDALPITEKTGLAFASEKQGVMHACGHDVHMSCALMCARILHELRNEWEGCVKFIFQPSEEDFRLGADVMIKEGVLDHPTPEYMFAMHVQPEIPCGQLGFKEGKYMASTDEIYLTVKGKQGHGATPELNVDSVLTSAYILTSLQQIVSRQAPPYIPTVLSFGRIIGEGRTNINPAEVKIDGTLRTFNEEWRASAHEKITRCAQEVAKAMGAECEVFIDGGYPFVYNNPELTRKAADLARELISPENVLDLELRMTAEDFAYFSHKIPSCLFRLGTGKKDVPNANLHSEYFDVDEDAIPLGIEMFCRLAVGL